MKIVVFGASGKTGSLLVEQALAKGHHVIAYVRRLGALNQQHPNLKIVTGRLSDTLKLKDAILGSDACISALGGGSLTKHATEVVYGIENIIITMESIGVNRFIYLSSIGVGESRYFMPPIMRFFILDVILRIPMADHNTNEKRIVNSKLNWTIARPVSLTDGPKTGNLNHGSDKIKLNGSPKISRANVAAFMLDQVTDNNYIKKAAWLYE
jgi:putative NADH-flavin reductase